MQNAVLSTDGKTTCRYMQVIQAILAQALSLLVHAYQTSTIESVTVKELVTWEKVLSTH